MSAVQTVVEAQGGVTEVAKRTSMDPQTLTKVLSSKDVPRVDTLRIILTALGCRLSIEPMGTEGLHGEKEDVDAVLATPEDIKSDMVFTRDNK